MTKSNDTPDVIYASDDCEWDADPTDPCLVEYIRGDVYHARVASLTNRLDEAYAVIDKLPGGVVDPLELSKKDDHIAELEGELQQLVQALEIANEILADETRIAKDAHATIVKLFAILKSRPTDRAKGGA